MDSKTWLGFWTVIAPDGKIYGTDRFSTDRYVDIQRSAVAMFGEGTTVIETRTRTYEERTVF